MLILVIAWICISFISIAWGNILLAFVSGLIKSSASFLQIEISIILLVGLSAIGCTAMYISLFLPINWKVQLFFLLVTLIYYCFRAARKQVVSQIRYLTSSITLRGLIFIFLCLFTVLLINSYAIMHPDTLAYHAQSIRWIQDYAATPGVVHLRRELGFQSVWFVLEALFNFRSLNTPMVFLVGGAVLAWFILFIIQKFGHPFIRNLNSGHQSDGTSWLALILLTYSFLSWTQIRLTAASASPDFIASLYILAAIHCFLKTGEGSNNQNVYFFLSSLFAMTAICIKLSAIVIVVLPVLSVLVFTYRKWWRSACVILSLLIIVSIPLLIRNYFASGWLLFPSRLLNFSNPDWKFDMNKLVEFQHYINAYARFPVSSSESEHVFLMPLQVWFTPWWHHLAPPDKGLLILSMVLIFVNIIFIKRIIAETGIFWGMAISVVMLGIIIWFSNAPDPRFASGFILSIIYLLVIPWKSGFDMIFGNKSRQTFLAFTFIFLIAIMFYSGYRITRFFQPSQIIFPTGMARTKYTTISCGGTTVNIINPNRDDCGSTPVPCVTDSCKSFEARGYRIEDGFREKK